MADIHYFKLPGDETVHYYEDEAARRNISLLSSSKADASNAITDVSYDSSNKKVVITKDGQSHDVVTVSTLKTAMNITRADIGLSNAENKSSATIRGEITSSNVTTALGYTPLNQSLKGSANGLAELDAEGKVPAAQLPSYVDSVTEYPTRSDFPTTGERSKIYVASDTNLTYRWSGSAYIEISSSLALGSTSSTAFRGDYGQAAYTHAVTNKGSSYVSGLYKITTNNEGHITNATEVQKSDITALGIPAQDTTYESKAAANSGTEVSLVTTGEKYVWNSKPASDTKTTAGATNSTDKLYIIGAKAQNSSPTTYSRNTAYIGTDGCLYSGGEKVLTGHQDISGKADKSSTVSNVAYDTTNKKLTKTINGTTSDIVSVSTLKTDMQFSKSDIGLGNVENKSSATIRNEITSQNVIDALGYIPSETDTTYTFDGTYNAITNKVATVETVGNAIKALDGGTIGTGGAGKTITSLSQTNGNVSATFGNISITKSQVSDFPTLGTAATKGVTDNSSSTAVTSSDTNLITGRTLYYAGYTKNAGTITGIKMNGASKGTSGIVDLGTVITAHQDISGKADKSATVSTVTYDSTNKKLTKTINGTTSDIVFVSTLKTAMGLAKGDVGLGNVENKSSATIRGELTSQNVIDALGFTPSAATSSYSFDGNYDASTNKIATVSTVTNAINALGTAAKKAVDTSISSSSANLPTSSAVANYVDNIITFITNEQIDALFA